jgi:putative phage-type endonuclease
MADRRTYIGGPDAAMIMGVSPYGSAFDVWQRKMGLTDETESSYLMEVGQAVESLILKYYTKITGYEIRTMGTALDIYEPWRGGTVDALALDADGNPVGVVEAKNTAAWNRSDWGVEGSDEIPDHYLIQGVWYMSLVELPWVDFPVSFGNTEPKIFRVNRNPKLEATILDRCRRFWHENVLAGVPPELDGSDGADAYLKSLYPRNTVDMIEGDENAERLMVDLSRHKADVEAAERKQRHAEQQLKQIIGEHDGVQCRNGKATWKADKNGKRRFKSENYEERSKNEH